MSKHVVRAPLVSAALFSVIGLFVACSTGDDGGGGGGGDAGTTSSSSGSSGTTSSSGSSGTSSSGSSGMSSGSSGGTDAGDAAPKPPECGRNGTLCKEGETCDGPPDCESKICKDNKCGKAAPGDGVKNGDETDVDCGGKAAPACDDGKGCLAKDDCVSGVCTGMICQAPSPTDGVKNGDETDIDCGGAAAPKCAVGKGCKVDGDCDNVKCDPVQLTCSPPSNSDGLKNGNETGVDCGGGAPTKCPVGQGCNTNADCDNVACDVGNTNTCLPPSPTDGLKNGNETDVDCGGAGNPGCGTGLTCATNADCASNGCDYKKKCAEHPSCINHNGGDTCGPNGNENCCSSLPAGAAVIDKYSITAGRMRAFIDAVGGDLRTYMTNNPPAWWNAAWNAFLPNVLDNGKTNPDDAPAFSGVYQELGPYVHGTAGGGNEGCYIAGSGARTYRLPDAVNTRMGDPQKYTQAFLDQRPLNCVTVYMIAAFCAWDGGRLPTGAELDVAWGNAKYPWGTTDPYGYRYAYDTEAIATNGTAAAGGFQAGPYATAPYSAAVQSALKLANYNYNYWGGATLTGGDYSIFIAPPGRFPNGNSATGHADLAGSVFNSMMISGTTARWSRNGSWQGHNIPWTAKGNFGSFPASNKYWAMGGRCAR